MRKKILFVCTANLQRSPTAEAIFKGKYDTKSAGIDINAENVLTKALLEWADIVFVMESLHREEISKRFPKQYMKKKIISLDIPDIYLHMNKKLIRVLKEKIKEFEV